MRAYKSSLDLVIRDYPTPIAGCDEQFNHLLEHRDRVIIHLRRLDDLGKDGAVPDHVIQEIASFMESSAYGRNTENPSDTHGH